MKTGYVPLVRIEKKDIRYIAIGEIEYNPDNFSDELSWSWYMVDSFKKITEYFGLLFNSIMLGKDDFYPTMKLAQRQLIVKLFKK